MVRIAASSIRLSEAPDAELVLSGEPPVGAQPGEAALDDPCEAGHAEGVGPPRRTIRNSTPSPPIHSSPGRVPHGRRRRR